MAELISDKEIVHTIVGYIELSEDIHNKIQQAYANLSESNKWRNENDIIYAASMPGQNNLSKGEIGSEVKDLEVVYTRYQTLLKQQIQETTVYIDELTNRLEKMNRIMNCYNNLPEDEHRILAIFYEDNKSFKAGLTEAMTRLNLERSAIVARRKKALIHIRKMYEKGLKSPQNEEILNKVAI